MEKTEINQRSPLRALETSLGGGLGDGDIGVVVARTGIGKTAFLVGIALDKLLRGRRVLHVSMGHSVEKVCAYYDEIFADLAHDQELSDVWQVRLEMERNRNIHVYSDGNMSADRLRQCLDALATLNASDRFAIPPDEVSDDGDSYTEFGWLPYVEAFGLTALAIDGDQRVLPVWEQRRRSSLSVTMDPSTGSMRMSTR